MVLAIIDIRPADLALAMMTKRVTISDIPLLVSMLIFRKCGVLGF